MIAMPPEPAESGRNDHSPRKKPRFSFDMKPKRNYGPQVSFWSFWLFVWSYVSYRNCVTNTLTNRPYTVPFSAISIRLLISAQLTTFHHAFR